MKGETTLPGGSTGMNEKRRGGHRNGSWEKTPFPGRKWPGKVRKKIPAITHAVRELQKGRLGEASLCLESANPATLRLHSLNTRSSSGEPPTGESSAVPGKNDRKESRGTRGN